jgi:outer membrane protein
MKTRKLMTLLLLLFSLPLFGQVYSLKKCVDYAKQNSSNVKIAYIDADVSNKVVKEQIGKGLPQIDISGSLEDKLVITTSLLPGELMGKPGEMIPVKMGTKFNFSSSIKLTQKIFDPSFWVGLKAAKISETMSEQNIQKTEEQMLYDVSAAFYRANIIQKQLTNLKTILSASDRTLKSVELKYKNGLARKIDVDKIKVSFNSTNSQVQQTELSYNQALNNLKFAMGMPVDSSIVLSESLPDSTSLFAKTTEWRSPVENRIEYKIQNTAITLYEADKQNNIAAYLPSLSFYANYGYQAMRSEFDFFKSGKDWYNSSSIGLELKIPVFSGFQKLAKVEQSALTIEKAKENLKYTEQSIKVEVSNYFMQFRNALDNIETERENLALAESVYKNTQLEYAQGTGSSLDLVQTESSLMETQNNYYNKLLTLYIAKLNLDKSQGMINQFINNLK